MAMNNKRIAGETFVELDDAQATALAGGWNNARDCHTDPYLQALQKVARDDINYHDYLLPVGLL